MSPEKSSPDSSSPRLSAFAVLYLAASLLALFALVLVIWPTSTQVPSWARDMSDEVRYLIIAATGGALSVALKATLAMGRGADPPWSLTRGPIGLLVHLILALQFALIVYFAIRSFVLLPTTPVSGLSPFGVLAVGLLAGLAVEEVVPNLMMSRLSGSAMTGIESRIDLIANAVGAATLDNYQGRLCMDLLDDDGKTVFDSLVASGSTVASELSLKPNRRYRLLAWFEPGARESQTSEVVSITGGNDVSQVTFVVAADSSAALQFTPNRRTFAFDPLKPSERMEFAFVAPLLELPITLWLRATQKGRLAAVLSVAAVARSAS